MNSHIILGCGRLNNCAPRNRGERLSRRRNWIKKALIKTKDLEEFPFIALNEVHCLGEQVQAFCYQQDVNLEIVCYTTQLSTVQSCVAFGLGISLVPQMLAACDTTEQVHYYPISDDTPSRRIVAASHTGRLSSWLSQQFVALVRDEYHQLEANFDSHTGVLA